ncbi:MAG: hypothetical protein JWM53_2400 [bacterium]|nr:hypothetical protein [bacterium]
MLVLLLALVVVGESSGVARAFGPGSTVHCCCGTHSAARPCPCPDCPVTLHRATPHDVGDARLAAGRDCNGSSADEVGVLGMLAVAPHAIFAALAPDAIGAAHVAAPSPLHGRAVDVGRPPP